jgi:SPP1 gp7 family putative phage head morphogenesis protein
VADSPLERLLRELIERERIANTLAQESRERHVDLFRRIEALFRRVAPPEVERTRYRREREAEFFDELGRLLRSEAPEMEAWLKGRLAIIGRQAAKNAEADLIATLGTVARESVERTPVTQQRLRAILNTDPFRGRVLREHVQRHTANTLDRVRTQVRLGMVAEESVPDIVRRIRGRQVKGAARGFTGGVLQTTTRDAEALVRTAVTYISSEGMLETYRANEDITTGVRYVAVLDDRTTVICLALDGTFWAHGEDDVVVPGRDTHYNCRSTLIPEIDYEALGLPEPPPENRVVRDLSTVSDEDLKRKVSARRRTGDFGDVTTVPSNLAAEDWLRRQRPAVRNKLLGRTRAEAFMRNEVSLRDLIRDDLTTINLDELLRN